MDAYCKKMLRVIDYLLNNRAKKIISLFSSYGVCYERHLSDIIIIEIPI